MIARLRDVGFSYAHSGSPALTGVDLDLAEGRLIGVVGASGSGKSTLCSVVRGLMPDFHPGELGGDLEVLGRPLADWGIGELSVRIGYAFQNPFTQLTGTCETVFEEIAFGLENLGTPREVMVERVLDVAERLGLDPILERDPRRLSGGQRQKVAFASVIAMDLGAYVFDEPTSQLDPESSAEILDIIAGLRDEGRSVVLVEHDMNLLAEHADEIVVLCEGRVVRHGPAADVLGSDDLASWGVVPPEVTALSVLLDPSGAEIGRPVTLAQARTALSLEGDRHGD